MKKLSIVFLLMLAVFIQVSCVATYHIMSPDEQKLIITRESTFNKDALFDKIIEYLSINFNKANEAIQLKDKENGKIIAKGSIDYKVQGNLVAVLVNCRFTLIIDVKDSKYRATFTNLEFYKTDGTKGNPVESVVIRAHETFTNLVDDIDMFTLTNNSQDW